MTHQADARNVRSVPVRSWDDLLREIEALERGWIFRGQRRSAWPLETTLERDTPENAAKADSETQLVREFRRRAHLYVSPHALPESDVEWLALMQHHGAPTRLLDFTRSPYVAIYFAVERAEKDDEFFSVWAIDELGCRHAMGARVRESLPEWNEKMERVLSEKNDIDRNLLATYYFHEHLLRESVKGVLPVEPERLSERLSAQQGTFVALGNANLSFMENMSHLELPGGTVIRLDVAASVRPLALERLRQMNITRTTLFPGLDGYAQSFRQFLVKEPSEARSVRLALNFLARSGSLADLGRLRRPWDSSEGQKEEGDDDDHRK